jgi:hypothetical protein
MFLRTIYERIQMNRIVNFKGNRAERHACASSNICRMPHPITVWEPAGSQKKPRPRFTAGVAQLRSLPAQRPYRRRS